jgi:hypothetical protein
MGRRNADASDHQVGVTAQFSIIEWAIGRIRWAFWIA